MDDNTSAALCSRHPAWKGLLAAFLLLRAVPITAASQVQNTII